MAGSTVSRPKVLSLAIWVLRNGMGFTGLGDALGNRLGQYCFLALFSSHCEGQWPSLWWESLDWARNSLGKLLAARKIVVAFKTMIDQPLFGVLECFAKNLVRPKVASPAGVIQFFRPSTHSESRSIYFWLHFVTLRPYDTRSIYLYIGMVRDRFTYLRTLSTQVRHSDPRTIYTINLGDTC